MVEEYYEVDNNDDGLNVPPTNDLQRMLELTTLFLLEFCVAPVEVLAKVKSQFFLSGQSAIPAFQRELYCDTLSQILSSGSRNSEGALSIGDLCRGWTTLCSVLSDEALAMLSSHTVPRLRGLITGKYQPNHRIFVHTKGTDYTDRFPKEHIPRGRELRRSPYLKGSKGGPLVTDHDVYTSDSLESRCTAMHLLESLSDLSTAELDVILTVRCMEGGEGENIVIGSADPAGPVLHPFVALYLDVDAITELRDKITRVRNREYAKSYHVDGGVVKYHLRPKIEIFFLGNWEVVY